MKAVIPNVSSEVTAGEKRQALLLVLNSRTLARAEQLKSLLRFVCEAEMEGRTGDITEYDLARRVLGRPAEYDPTEDSSVRTRVYELRQRLEKYYQMESPKSALRIVLPKGSYVPQFERRFAREPILPAPLDAVAPEQVEVDANPSVSLSPPARPWLWALAGALAAALVTFLATSASAAKADPVVAEAWGPLAQEGASALISIAVPLHLAVVPETLKAVDSKNYPVPDDVVAYWPQPLQSAIGAKLGSVFTDNVVGFGIMTGVLTTTNTLRGFGATAEILPERVSPLSTYRNRHVVLFGTPMQSDATARLEEGLPLSVDYDKETRGIVIRDREKHRIIAPERDERGQFRRIYGLITVRHDRESPRGPLGMVVFSGVTSVGAQAAAEYFSSPKSLSDLKARFQRDGHPGFPEVYQVVVSCTLVNKLLISYDWAEHRVPAKLVAH